MLSRSEAAAVVWSWIEFTGSRNMIAAKRRLWLLYDYLRGDMSARFYREHAGEAREIVESLDSSKDRVADVSRIIYNILVDSME